MKWFINIIGWIDYFLANWDTSKPPEKLPMNKETPPVEPTTAPQEVYLWDTPEHARHSVRLICDEELPLTRSEEVQGKWYLPKDIIDACIHQESGFNNAAINRNYIQGRLASTDWGICQINDYYHVGAKSDFPSVEFVVNNPEKCVRWMIQCYKKGHLGWWVSYSSGAFIKYLPK